MVTRIAFSTLLIAHTAGIMAASIVAVFKIETILVSGPLLGISGICIAIVSRRRRIGFYFGALSAASVVGWFLIINLLSWDPDRAYLPVSVFLILFSLGSVPASVFCVSETFRPAEQTLGWFQFDIRTLLYITFFLAVYFGILRSFGIFSRL